MVEGVNSSVIYLIYYKNRCKCHNASLPSTEITNNNNNMEVPQKNTILEGGRHYLHL
jgi:hypothetical protein